MSVWTHLAGVIRFDTMRHLPGAPTIEATKRFVQEGVPEGSELPVDLFTCENPEPNALAAYVVAFSGDLRDYGDGPEDIPKIEKWLNGIADGAARLRLAIRQIVVSAEVEFLGTTTWVGVTDGAATVRVRLVRTFEPHKE